MKRTAGAFVLLAALGGCMSADKSRQPTETFGKVSQAREIKGLVGPHGEPVPMGYNGRAYMPSDDQVRQSAYASASNAPSGVVQVGGRSAAGCTNCGPNGEVGQAGGHSHGLGGGFGGGGLGNSGGYGQVPNYHPRSGILPVPGMGPAGAVAAIGALPAYGAPVPTNARTSIKFSDPVGMKITWFANGGLNDVPLETPTRYNFLQGGVYRLKLSEIPKRPDLTLYPTLEVLPSTLKSATFLAHSSVPVAFTDQDFEQVASNNFLIKVVYLPDPQYQDIAAIGQPSEISTAQLDPGVDPVVEAQKRGTVLLIIRMGNIDLENRNSPAMNAPGPRFGGAMPRMMPTPAAAPVNPILPTSATAPVTK